jgi:HAD superfamily hydrolase (TIGR01509 family)
MAIETVLLDAGSVLVYPNWARVSDTLTRHGVPVSEEALRSAEPAAKRAIDDAPRIASTTDADRGSLYFSLVFEGAGLPRGPRLNAALDELWAYHGEHNLWEHVPPEVPRALEALRSLGVTLAVASNANGLMQRLLARVGLDRYFRAVCDSCVEGVEKPDPRFFQIVLERAGGEPSSAIHVGDLYHVDVMGARRAGIRAVLLDPHNLYGDYGDVERVSSVEGIVDLVRSERTDYEPLVGR